MKPTFILINKMTPFVFVVPPLDLNVQLGQIEKSIELIDFGEIVKIGEERPASITFSTFIPSLKSPFYDFKNPLLPSAAIELLKKWKKDKAELTFTIPEFLMYYKCKISLLEYEIKERTGDIHVRLTLIQQRKQDKVTDNITGLFKR